MKKLKVQAVYDWLDSVAPFESQEAFDNAGLQAGDPEQDVTGILLTLDVTADVLMEAESQGANLIISHHPLIFSPLSSLRQDLYVPRVLSKLIKSDIALISAHTNLDKSAFSSGRIILEQLGMANIQPADDYVLVGDFETGRPAHDVRADLERILETPVLAYGNSEKTIRALGVAGGAYSEGFLAAQAAGADALLTGEIRHHHAVEAAERDVLLFEGGHFATEKMMMTALAQGLQSHLDAIEWNVQVCVSRQIPYLRK